MSSDKEIVIKVIADIKDIKNKVESLEDDFARFSNKVGKHVEKISNKVNGLLGFLAKIGFVIQGVESIYRVASGIAEPFLSASSDMEEIMNKFDVVFGESAKEVEEWSLRFGKAVGRSQIELREMLNTLQDTFVPLGIARDQSAKLSMALTQLAIDVASFNNANDMDVLRDFQSAIVGNHETVRKYGIVITEATLRQEALRSGIIETDRELTEQEKIQARLNLIFKGSADAMGDAVNTAGSFANTLKRVRSFLLDMSVVIGNKVKPYVQELLNAFLMVGNFIRVNFNAILHNTVVILSQAVRWFTVLASGVASYLAITKASVIWQRLQVTWTRLQTLWTKRAEIAQRGLNLAMKVNPIGLIVSLLTMLVGAFISTGDGLEALKSVFQAFWVTARDVMKNFWSIVRLVFYNLSTPFRFAFNVIKNFASGFRDIFGSMGNIVKGFWKIITGDFEEGWKEIESGVSKLGESLKTTLVSSIEETIDPVKEELKNIDFSESEEAWKEAGKKVKNAFKDVFTGGIGIKKLKVVEPEEVEVEQTKIPEIELKGNINLKIGKDSIRNTIKYYQYIEGLTYEAARQKRIEYLRKRIEEIKGANEEELKLKIQLMDELNRLEEESQEKIKARKEAQIEMVARLIRGEGYVYEDIQDRILAKASETTAKLIMDAEYREEAITLAKEKWQKVRITLEKTWSAIKNAEYLKEMAMTKAAMVKDTIAAGVSLVKSAMAKIPFPFNLAAATGGITGLFAIINNLKSKAGSILKLAEGGVVEKATLALVGEMGPEIVAPKVNFERYVTQTLTPMIQAQVKNQNVIKQDLTPLQREFKEGFKRLEKAIYQNRVNEKILAREIFKLNRGRL